MQDNTVTSTSSRNKLSQIILDGMRNNNIRESQRLLASRTTGPSNERY